MLDHQYNPVDTAVHAVEQDTCPAPVAGNPILWPCPDNARVLVVAIQYQITAVPATAFPLVYVAPATGSDMLYATSHIAPDALAATDLHFSAGIRVAFKDTVNLQLFAPLPRNLIMEPGDTLKLSAVGIGATAVVADGLVSYHQWIIA